MTNHGFRTMKTRATLTLLLAALASPLAARAQSEIDVLNRAIEDYNDGKNQRAAIGFYKLTESAAVEDNRFKSEYYLAQALNKLGMGFGAFFYYGQIIKAGPGHPYYFKAVEGALNVTEAYNDEILGPNVLNKAYNDQFARLPPEALAKINYYIALLGYRSGRYAEAEQFLYGVPAESNAYAQAQYLSGLLLQRTDAEKAVGLFRGILAMDEGKNYRDLPALKELTHLALGRTLYGLRRYKEAAFEYGQLPRFSRHWDEALFEGAYADLMNDDPGGALGKLHSLHSPHLTDEFAPESVNLAAIIYYMNCLYPQTRGEIDSFNRKYVPIRDEVKKLLDGNPSFDDLASMVAPRNAKAGLPAPVRNFLGKNERVDAAVGYIAKLDEETARVKAESELAASALGVDLLDLIQKQRALVIQVGGKFVKGRLVDLLRLLDVLDGDKEIIGFETTKGEKEFLEGNVNVKARLAQQKLYRPEMPATGHEYWPFDGEYWPDEIGYYRYTLKNACPVKKKDE